jgi:hypothetical protein
VLEIEIGGSGGIPGTDFDVLTVGGTATFNGGAIHVNAWNDHTPAFGETFDVLVATALVDATGGALTLGGTYGDKFLYQVVDGTTLRLISQVPEPASLGLLALGGLALLKRQRKP